MINIKTNRLLLRQWRDTDLEQFVAINQDPKVMRYLPKVLSHDEVQQMISKMKLSITKNGYGFYACEEKSSALCIGFIGLNKPSFKAHFTPCVEIGWRLGSQYWNQGYATEGAKAVLDFGFHELSFPEIVSFTVPNNKASIRVMEKIGLILSPKESFLHPLLPQNHKLSKHVLYRLKKSEYKNLKHSSFSSEK